MSLKSQLGASNNYIQLKTTMGKISDFFKSVFAKNVTPRDRAYRIDRVCPIVISEFNYKVVGNVETTLRRLLDMGLVEGRDFVRRFSVGNYQKFGEYQYVFMLTGEAFQEFMVYQLR